MNPISPETQATPSRLEPRRQGGLVGWLGLALALGTLICFWPVSRYGFVLYEDPLTVSQHPTIQQGLSWANFVWCFKSITTCNWQPLTSLSHMLDCQLFGLDAGKHHLVSVLIHAANVVLLFLLLRRLTGAVWRSAFVAALFGWHPMHVESVVWISERKDVLGGFFFLLTIWAYCRYTECGVRSAECGMEDTKAQGPGRGRAIGFYALALGFYALGLMSKPNVVTLPFVLLLLDYWPLGRMVESRTLLPQTASPTPHSAFRIPHWKRLLAEKVPFFAFTVADCVTTVVEQKVYGSLPSLEMFPVGMRLENALTNYAVYFRQLFWPGDMAVFYLFPHSFPLWQPLVGALLLVVVSALVVWQLRKQPWLAVGWFWFLGILVPMIGVVQTGVQSRSDHHTYLAYIGLGLMLAWGLPAVLQGLTRRPEAAPAANPDPAPPAEQPQAWASWQIGLGLAGVAVLGACWYGARAQLAYWQDSVTLFRHTVQITQKNEAAHNMLGSALLQEGKREEAAQEFRETLRIEPYYPTFRCRAYDNLGILFLQDRRLDEAIAMLSEALKLQSNAPSTHFNLGAAYGQQGHMDKAEVHFRAVAAMPPGNDIELNDADLQSRVARGLIRCGKADEALKHCQDLVAAHPESPGFRSVLAGICVLLNRPEEAIVNLREAVRRAPRVPVYLNQLASLLASASEERLRNGTEAVELAERACELTQRQNAAFLDTLGMAYAEANRFPEAVIAAEEARALAQSALDQRSAETIARKLELYRAGKPYHQP